VRVVIGSDHAGYDLKQDLAAFCEAVSCLRIAVTEGKVLQLRAASEQPAVGDGLETDASTPGAEKEKARRTEPSGL